MQQNRLPTSLMRIRLLWDWMASFSVLHRRLARSFEFLPSGPSAGGRPATMAGTRLAKTIYNPGASSEAS